MREKLRKFIIKVSIFQLISKFDQILILVVFRLIQYAANNFLK